jgi:hypothetical protein
MGIKSSKSKVLRSRGLATSAPEILEYGDPFTGRWDRENAGGR